MCECLAAHCTCLPKGECRNTSCTAALPRRTSEGCRTACVCMLKAHRKLRVHIGKYVRTYADVETQTQCSSHAVARRPQTHITMQNTSRLAVCLHRLHEVGELGEPVLRHGRARRTRASPGTWGRKPRPVGTGAKKRAFESCWQHGRRVAQKRSILVERHEVSTEDPCACTLANGFAPKH